jgi:predicted RND superfamily exporter protein
VDLISVLGLLMVFGFSIDYGVFSTDLYQKNSEALSKMSLNELEHSVFSTLSLAAFTNLVGFFPLVFTQHVVLHQLGYALFFGTVGTYIGTIWGVPYLLKPRDKTP